MSSLPSDLPGACVQLTKRVGGQALAAVDTLATDIRQHHFPEEREHPAKRGGGRGDEHRAANKDGAPWVARETPCMLCISRRKQ